MSWVPIGKYGVVIYPYIGSGPSQLSVELGATVFVEDEAQGWYKVQLLDSVNNTPSVRGVIPTSYVTLETSGNRDWEIAEIALVLKNWLALLKKLIKEKKYSEYRALKERINWLLDCHQKLNTPLITESRRKELKEKAINKIEEGRRLLGLDMIVRSANGDVATDKNTPLISLYNMHRENTSNNSLLKSSNSSGGNNNNNNNNVPVQMYHLLLDFKIFMCSVGEQTEIYVSIYNKTTEKFITEEFLVILTSQGMPYDVTRIGKLKTIFTDLPAITSETVGNYYLVCKLFRKGKLVVDSKSKKEGVEYRRPFGCSCYNLDDTLLQKVNTKQEVEITMAPIYSSAQESNFATLHEAIIKKNTALYQEVPKAKGIVMGLTMYSGENKQSILEQNSTLKDVTITQRFGFPEIILPNTVRNDFYVCVESGEFSQDRKTSAKNVEVTVTVVKDNGEQIKDCIIVGTSEKIRSEYRTFVLYHVNNPIWLESFKIQLPVNIEQCHLCFTAKHCSSSDNKDKVGSSVAFLKFTNMEGTMVQDKVYQLDISKRPKNGNDPVFYLKEFPGKISSSSSSGSNSNGPTGNNNKKGELIRVRTFLVSTKLTHNNSMLSLLKWTNYKGNLSELLNQFKYVDQSEIVKFLPETFDAMFAILDSKDNNNSNKAIATPVYTAIVSTIALLVDEKKKYSNFKPVLDTYIEKQFKSGNAHIQLMSCLKQNFDEVETNPAQISRIIPTLKTLQYIFKFITTSRSLYNRQQNDKQDVWFKKDLLDVLNSFNNLMTKTSPEFVGAQTLALKNFSTMFQDLASIFDVKEYCNIVCKFIESVQYDEKNKLMNIEKLVLIQKLINSNLFGNIECRQLLLPVILKQLKKHISSNTTDEVYNCILIVSNILSIIQSKSQVEDKGTTINYLLTLVDDLIVASQKLRVATIGPVTDIRLDLVTCLLCILYLVDKTSLISYINQIHPISLQLQFLLNLTKFMKELLIGRSYNETWFAMCMFQYSTLSTLISIIGQFLEKNIPHLKNDFNNINSTAFQLYGDFISFCITFIKLNGLALENFNEQKQNIIKDNYGDLRLIVCDVFKSLWIALDTIQFNYLTIFVGPFLELMLCKHPTIITVAVTVYTTLLIREYYHSKSFTIVERYTIQSIDKYSNEGYIDEYFKENFINSLEVQFNQPVIDAGMKQQGKLFLTDIKQLLTLLINIRRLPDVDTYEDERTIATMKLMEYLKETNRKDTYIKYVHKLCDEHVASNNFTEAGLTLLLHADLLLWSDTLLEEQGDFPAESNRQRKERLIRTAIDHLDKAKLWEKCIDLIKDLRLQYENVIYDYQKLSDILQFEANLFRKINNNERFFSNYFRVGFYGKGFDSSIANKEYIYRGFELERIQEFIARIQIKFPKAQLLTYTEMPPIETINSDQQYLQIYSVKPSSKEEMEGKEKIINKRMPPLLQKYAMENNVNVFLYSRPFRKNKKSSNEFKDLWVCNMYSITEDAFPTIHRRSEIIQKLEVMVSPIDNALNSILEKNKELQQIVFKHENGTKENISPFTMILKGVIDAAVNGGVNIYRDAFFSPEYLNENPDKKLTVIKLKESLVEQLDILEKGLIVHAKVCSEDFGALQEQLENQFQFMKTTIKDY